jgi:hypothetical protein
VQPHGGRDLDVGHPQRHFRQAGRGPDRAAKAGRVAGREELFGVRARPVGPGRESFKSILPSGLVALPSRPAVELAVSVASTAMVCLLEVDGGTKRTTR